MYVFVHSVLWMWGQENLQWLVLFFHHMCLDQTLVIRPDSQTAISLAQKIPLLLELLRMS